jgi:hypothetical protein
MADLLAPVPRPAEALDPAAEVTSTTARDGRVRIRLTMTGTGAHEVSLRTDNLEVSRPTRTVRLRTGRPATIEWTGRLRDARAPWVALLTTPSGARLEVPGSGQ